VKESRRFFERHDLFVAGRLIFSHGALDGTVVNISPGGAGILVPPSTLPPLLELSLLIETSEGTVRLPAQFVHCFSQSQGTYLGIEFEDLPRRRSAKLFPIFAQFVSAFSSLFP